MLVEAQILARIKLGDFYDCQIKSHDRGNKINTLFQTGIWPAIYSY